MEQVFRSTPPKNPQETYYNWAEFERCYTILICNKDNSTDHVEGMVDKSDSFFLIQQWREGRKWRGEVLQARLKLYKVKL